ncbi:pyridoxamine 5'-phosphate oxidase family protein [uncultured Tateyamaria sp.]|uniref:pyridoxamine 5'-phosphate oxidase family protein n=1 Tax=uncultured Tateyamaria sp. TaxID=455651 RepID=UPI0026196BE2|nr:pyridoxamine 5'-phosphate oxidase family protein [uncultured Tateyamaria sp.]
MFHSGELAIQHTVGVREVAAANSKLIWPSIPDRVIPFVAAQSYCVVGGTSVCGDIWAEFVVGTAGFATVVLDGTSLTLPLGPGGLLERQFDLSTGNHMGLLFIDLSTRKRLRVNGRIAATSGQELTLSVDQAYPNCPKYIQARRLTTTDAPTDPHRVETGTTLPKYAWDWITKADMFFVASTAADGAADVSHRGGNPGFIRTQGQTLFIPDYHGNSMFSTLGNFLLHSGAGLVFADFETNRMLQLTGDVELDLDASGDMPASVDTGRWWTFRPRKYVVSLMGSSVSAEFIDASPFNPAVFAAPVK